MYTNNRKLKQLINIQLLFVSIITGLMAISFIIGPLVIFQSIGLEKFSNSAIYSQIIGPLPLYFFGTYIYKIPEIPTIFLFSLLWLISLIIFVIISRTPNSIISKIIHLFRNRADNRIDNNLFTIIITFTSLLFILLVVEIIQINIGITTGVIPLLDPLTTLTLLQYAAVAEEIGYRVGIIGIMTWIYLSVIKRRTESIKILYNPSYYLKEYLNKKQFNYSIKFLFSINIISSVLFGLSHFSYGGGWEVGKISLAAIAGVALGWLYITRGLFVSIALHWCFNYFLTTYYYVDQIFNTTYLANSIYLLLLLVGLLNVIIILTKYLSDRNK